MKELELYRPLRAVSSKDFNTCFYCGCIATLQDLAPPIQFAEFYLKTREDADFYQVPSCKECFQILKHDKSGSLGQRVDNLKKRLAKKYQKAIRIYELWDHDEVDELDHNLGHSIKAGLSLGEESYQRYKYRGFEFEVEGVKHDAFYVKAEVLTVFGEKFDNFRDALEHASRSFRIPKAKLKEMFAEHNNSFDLAIRKYQDDMAQKLYEKELKSKCKEFANKYKQNMKFVMRTVEIYRENDKFLTIDGALKKLLNERINVWLKQD